MYYLIYNIYYLLFKPYMLLEEGSGECIVPPYGGGSLLYADCCRDGLIQQPNTSSTMCRLSGVSGLFLLRWLSRIVPAMPMCVSPLGVLRVRGGRFASLLAGAKAVKEKPPTLESR